MKGDTTKKKCTFQKNRFAIDSLDKFMSKKKSQRFQKKGQRVKKIDSFKKLMMSGGSPLSEALDIWQCLCNCWGNLVAS